ncbi:AMP-binding protein [Metapseudomonas resinovorans]|uniref:Putative fatty-acid--CoA ligase n=1 Tax=Metapseudomonas resinovorans NBRC 106553 TaxID=1245471 RepID=S6ATP5_METRE|nr:AMP-binding protein [Pseudomonas resinovorans]BAN47541.1 putative fatty-acid--CoA ligase [Pseudomonas resinovorans NBRC 106553]
MSEQLPLQRFAHWVERAPDRVWLRQPVARTWHPITWREADDRARRMASALRAMGCEPGDRVAILAKNCAEWLLSDLAIMLAGLVSVPLYPLQSAASIDYVLRHSACKVIILGKLDDAERLEPGIPAEIRRIAMPYPTLRADHGWGELLALHEPLREAHEQRADDLLSILYTSGTTGQPKGVMQTAGAFAFASSRSVAETGLGPDDQFFSYLPLSHAAERFLVATNSLYCGAGIAFVESLETFAEDLRAVRPTQFFSVPRLWTRFQQGVLERLPQSRLDRLLALPLLGALVAWKIRRGLGLDRARVLVSGAAPIPVALLEWYRRIGLTICEGYGMTENFAYGNFNRPGQVRFGTVGRVMPDNQLRIADDGEILYRSPSLMTGYYLEPDKSAETLRDGWLHTGDKGQIDADGYLRITGRVKDIFKTSKGKYVAPAPIEGEIAKSLWVEQVCLMGSGLDQPLALVELSPAARAQARAQVEADLLATLEQINGTLLPHERVSHLLLVREPWTVDNGCMTPTMKIRRNVLEARYAEAVDRLDARQALHWE